MEMAFCIPPVHLTPTIYLKKKKSCMTRTAKEACLKTFQKVKQFSFKVTGF